MENSIVGYILMENDTTFKEVSDLQVCDKNNLFYCRFNTILQSLDCLNRNKREYNGDAIVASLSTPEIQELIAHNKFKGEAGHPVGMPTQRIATVDPKCTCHRITKWWRDGELIRGTVETLDDGLYGTKLTKAILQGEDPSFSYRGFATMVKRNGHDYVATPPRCIAYDEVNLPSHKEAYAMPGRTFVDRDMKGNEKTFVKESEEYTAGDMSIAVHESDIADLVTRKSESLAIVCESFDLTPDMLTKITYRDFRLKKGGNTYVGKLEDSVARDVAYYFGNLF